MAGRRVCAFGTHIRLGDLRPTGRKPDFFADAAFGFIGDTYTQLDEYG
jgi:hypothetical protein